MYIKIVNHQENTARIIDYPGDLKTFLWAHSFGIFNIIKEKPGIYSFMDRFTGEIVDTISKPGKREITKFLKGEK